MQLYCHYQRRTTFYTHNAYTKYLRSLDMLMSIEIDKSRYKSIASPENFVIIDFYRQIKLINRQLLTIIEHYRLIDQLSDDQFRSTCHALILPGTCGFQQQHNYTYKSVGMWTVINLMHLSFSAFNNTAFYFFFTEYLFKKFLHKTNIMLFTLYRSEAKMCTE